MSLRERIEKLAVTTNGQHTDEHLELFAEFKNALNRGEVRAAEKAEDGKWLVNTWVKQGILLGFKMGHVIDMSPDDKSLIFFDNSTYPLRTTKLEDRVRIVPGGSSIRDGVYLAPSVICMPPMYANVGSYIDEGSMIDSHALVGSCAQIGKRVHLSAAAQVGGVLEPVGAVPVIIEDDVLVGGNCGIYEGTIVRESAVLAPGTILTGSTPVYDMVRGEVYRRTEESPLEIPAGAVVVPGSRPVTNGCGREWGLSVYAPVIVKYRDNKTASAIQLERAVR